MEDRKCKTNKSGILYILSSITGIIIVSKVLGLVKQIVVAGVYGATRETDVIFLSQNLLGNMEYVISQVFVTAFVSSYIHIKNEDSSLCDKFVSDVTKLLAGGSIAAACLMSIAAPVIARIIAPGYTVEMSRKLTFYIVLSSPVLFFYSLMAIFQSLLNANENYIPGQLIGLNQSVITIFLTLLLSKRIGIWALVCSFYLCPIWNMCFLWKKSKILFSIKSEGIIFSEELKKLLRMMGPLFLGYSMVFINQQVDKILVSGLEEGTVTALGYGTVLSNLVITFISSFCVVFFTKLTDILSCKNEGLAERILENGINLFVSFLLPISIIVFFCSNEIVTLCFGRGNFTGPAIINTSLALKGYGFLFIPNAIKNLYGRFLYGKQNSMVPMTNSSVGIVANIGLSVLLSQKWGVFGITFASGVSEMICAVLNFLYVKGHRNTKEQKKVFTIKWILWISGGLCCALACSFLLKRLKGMTAVGRLLIICLFAGGSYLILVMPVIIENLRGLTINE